MSETPERLALYERLGRAYASGFDEMDSPETRAILAEALVLLRRCQPCGPIPLRAIVAEFLERAQQAGYQ